MASVVFFLRSNIKNKPSSIWVRFKDKGTDISLSMKDLKCSVDEWKNGKCKNANKKMFDTDLESINTKLLKIEGYILQEYNNLNSVLDLKVWLKSCVNYILNPKEKSVYSSNLIDFIDTYLELRQNSITKRTNYKIKVLKSMLIDFCNFSKRPPVIQFKEMDNYFKDSFEKYCLNINYKHDTIYSKLKDAKAISKFAENYDIETHPHTKEWKLGVTKFVKDKPKHIYLSLEELERIKNCTLIQDDLDIARDWLIVACFSGQRVSDFLRFEKSMIVEDKDMRYIEFRQEKTRKLMQIPILKEVQKILDKRNGEFPKKISDVKLNQDIKIVCKHAKITELVYGSKSQVLEDKTKRGVLGNYPKYKLVASHIGRRSFATNFHTLLPTADVMYVTGHSTEKQFLMYIGKTEKEMAVRAADSFAKIGF
ncbi:phage integrase SAM-like domain-containing protein [Chryseobacterium sp. MEBOG07]|uniref:phage integrase SAM-like domain-containing protein n=1 Tax=Chryseobacterium sp. MEBOG07 TaxID=2879939 RepID=UPI001F42248B|nr:phage integrase SAM-like domain-containing protein [Chryseobacterium sp. MEBOG07]UKB81287.1 phage integrase SAM-like domain-containing protein [Chryseobacterium sp. MEBOG07]